jgi:hypothetical protein
MLHANPSQFLNENQEWLLEAQNVEVLIATFSRSLCGLATMHMEISKSAAERNEL